MAGLYDDRIMGLRQQQLMAQKLREQSSGVVPEGQMVGGHYIANTGGAIANAIKSVMAGYQEGQAKKEEEDLTRQKYQDIAKTMGSMGITPSENLLKQSGTPEESPSIGARLGALVRFQDQPKPTPAQPYSVNVNANPTPENQRAGILNLLDNAPEYAGNIIALQKLQAEQAKTAREELDKHTPIGFERNKYGQLVPMDVVLPGNKTVPYTQHLIDVASAKENHINPIEAQNMNTQLAHLGISKQQLDLQYAKFEQDKINSEKENNPLDETSLAYASQLIANGIDPRVSRKDMPEVYKYASEHGITPEDQRTAQLDLFNEKNTERAFASGGVQGKALIALGAAGRHLETLDKLIEPLNNNPTRAINKLTQWYSEQTGSPVPTTFDSAKRIVADEVMKTIVPNVGSVREREALQEDLSRASSPEQLKGVMNAWKELIAGKVVSLANSYKAGTRKPFDYERYGVPPEWNPDKKPAPTEIDPIQAELTRRENARKGIK